MGDVKESQRWRKLVRVLQDVYELPEDRKERISMCKTGAMWKHRNPTAQGASRGHLS